MAERAITFFVPSNRTDSKGRRTHVDGWNEYVRAQNANRYAAARMERENVGNVESFARAAMLARGFRPPEAPARVSATFFEVNSRRDVANVLGGLKWLLDGLSRPRGSKRAGAGLIVDDSPRWCELGEMRVEVDAERPGVLVTVEFPEGGSDDQG